MGTLSAAGRMVAAGWTLSRHDALLPREYAALAPAPVRAAAGALRLLAGGAAAAGRPGERLARAFEALGPVAVKLGQLLSTRADIFGATFADDLSRHLKDKLPPFPLADARGRRSPATWGARSPSCLCHSSSASSRRWPPPASPRRTRPSWLKDGRKRRG